MEHKKITHRARKRTSGNNSSIRSRSGGGASYPYSNSNQYASENGENSWYCKISGDGGYFWSYSGN